MLTNLWYDTVASLVPSQDWARFFDWLAREEPYFVDDYKLNEKLQDWTRIQLQKHKTQGVPDSFMDYVSLYSVLANDEHIRRSPGSYTCPYYRIRVVCNGILSKHRDVQNEETRHLISPSLYVRFIGLSESDCYAEFFRLLKEYRVNIEELDIMEGRLQQFKDITVESLARRHAKPKEAVSGGKVI